MALLPQVDALNLGAPPRAVPAVPPHDAACQAAPSVRFGSALAADARRRGTVPPKAGCGSTATLTAATLTTISSAGEPARWISRRSAAPPPRLRSSHRCLRRVVHPHGRTQRSMQMNPLVEARDPSGCDGSSSAGYGSPRASRIRRCWRYSTRSETLATGSW
jgi:hypothetical protein